jgi:AraC family transcriptional regulator
MHSLLRNCITNLIIVFLGNVSLVILVILMNILAIVSLELYNLRQYYLREVSKINQPKSNFGYFFTPNVDEKENFFFTNGLGHIHSDPDFMIDRDEYFDYLVMYVVNGKLHVQQYNQSFSLMSGDMVLMSLFDKHKYYSDRNSPCDVLWIHFNGKDCHHLISFMNNYNKLPIILNSCHAVFDIIKRCFTLAKSKESGTNLYMSLFLYELIIEILYCLYLKNPIEIRTVKDVKLIKCIDEYIDENSHRPITLKMLSNHIQMSPYHFAHLFKQATDKSPIQYATEKKIEKSKYLLLYTSKSISTIANELGFADQSHFSRIFKTRMGVSPSTFRQKYPSL